MSHPRGYVLQSCLSRGVIKRKAVCSKLHMKLRACLFLTVRSTTMRPWKKSHHQEEKIVIPGDDVACKSMSFATQNVTGRQRWWKRRMTGEIILERKGIRQKTEIKTKKKTEKVDTLGRTWKSLPLTIFHTHLTTRCGTGLLSVSCPSGFHPHPHVVLVGKANTVV